MNDSIKRTLGLHDVIGIIVGIIIGSAIFRTPSDIAGLLGSGYWIIAIWVIGGLFSFIGGLCYAELASAYPKEGGDYFFLQHTYGRWAGFLYAWGRLWVIHSGNIAMMASIAGIYGALLFPFPHAEKILAILAIILFTIINCLGLRLGKWTENVLAAAQVIGLAAVIIVGFFFSSAIGHTEISQASTATTLPAWGSFFLAFIFVQLAYGGWSDCAFVAAEVKQPEKNIFRALMIGIAIVVAVYCLVNMAVLFALGPQGMASSKAVMTTVMEGSLGTLGGNFISLIIVICALASVNGMILVGGRIYHPFGKDHTLFRFLGQWNENASVPLAAFIMQGIVAIVLLMSGTFEKLVIFTSSAHWFFMTFVGISLIILRFREADVPRPYRVPLFPILPLLYILVCCMLLYSSFSYAKSITPYGAWIGFGLVFSGLPVYWVSNKISRSKDNSMV